MPGKPYKVWNANRAIRKAVVAGSLQDLIGKGTQQLGLAENSGVKVVLEEDGTEVDDEEYFQFLADQTTFIFLATGEKWHPVPTSEDETDFFVAHCGEDTSEASDGGMRHLVDRIRSDVSSIITFTTANMEMIVVEDVKRLSSLLHKTEKETRDIQAVCRRYLDDRQEAQEAIGLLNLVREVQRQQSNSKSSKDGAGDADNGNKRQRLE